MATQIERIYLLLAAHGRGVMRRHRTRPHDLYGAGQVFGTLMRHEAVRAPVAELLLASGVIALTLAACLVSRPRGTQRVTPRKLGTGRLAVPIAAVAAQAQEEHLAAPTTRDEA
jgi:hypothetical protein